MSELTQNRGQAWLMILRTTIEAAAAFFITAALLNYGVASSAIGRWFASMQLIPAALALMLPTLALWLAITLVFGRIYCSTVCPLGALIDLGSHLRPQSRPFRWSRPHNALRIAAFTLAAILLVLHIPAARNWVDPYGLYANIVGALTSGRVGLAAILAAAIVGALGYVAYSRGRLFCNTICPLSAPLGLVARNAAFHIDINTDRCTQCRRCVDACKARCINLDDHVADMSRCVVCFNCLPVCPNDAIAYTLSRHTLSHPLLQKIKPIQNSTPLTCNNTSTSSKTSSTTESAKPTAPEPEH
ncbi:MAG: 4Fe-4S binding protein [Muribaculaceae bacterium]|nr:4Fe-4S binding protein [Muribaculaceae bacterium]